MSLAINPDQVEAVLLADGWHTVKDDSFELDSYEFVRMHPSGNPDKDRVLHGGRRSGVCATGFAFHEGETTIYGPLTSIVAVRTERFS